MPGPEDSNNASGVRGSGAGPTAFHRRSSWIVRKGSRDGTADASREWRTLWPLFKWHIYDNHGSYNGWFDWLPQWMRVGPWSPVAVVFLIGFYVSMVVYRPRPLEIASVASHGYGHGSGPYWWLADVAVFAWGVFVMVRAKRSMDSMAGFWISYTGWAWLLLTARAGLEAAAAVLVTSAAGADADAPSSSSSALLPAVANTLAVMGSALRFPAAVAAVITFTLWNVVLFPLIAFVATPPGPKREGFLKFNFGFFMTNVHVLNFPLALIGNVYGPTARFFTESDLWLGYLVVMLYSMLYLFVMDRLGLHFYPIFCPRSFTCAISFGLVLFLYHFLLHQGNAIMVLVNPHLASSAP